MANEETVQRNDSGPWVTYLQQCLNAWTVSVGNNPLAETGTFDDATEGLVRFFQGTVGLSESGVADEQTWAALNEKLGGDTAASGETAGSETAEYSEPLALETTVELKADGTIVVNAGNPAQRIAAESQFFTAWTVFADGSEHSGPRQFFPTKALDPGAYESFEWEFAYGTKDHGDLSGSKLYVYQTEIGKTVLPFDVVDGECRPTGEVSFET